MYSDLNYRYVLLCQLKTEKENEKQALVAVILLGADF